MDVSVEYLIYNLQDSGLSDDEIYNLLEKLSGFRVYIKKTDILRYKIKKRYYQLKSLLPLNEIIALLSKEFEKSPSRIRAYLNEFKN